MNALINNFAAADSKIAKAVRSIINLKPSNPVDFRLQVRTPGESEAVIGMYAAEAQVILTLLDMAYNELVGTLNKLPRKDSVAVADRGRTLSEFDDEYLAADEPEATYKSIEELQEEAAVAASMVHRYAEHIAAIKDGGAGWIVNGFSQAVWIAADAKDEATIKAMEDTKNLPDLIKGGKVKRVQAHVSGRLHTFKAWCDAQLRTDWINTEWKTAIAYASVCLERCPTVDVNDARDYIGDWASKCAPNKTTSRLALAVERVANKKWSGLSFALNKGESYISPSTMLLISYSPKLAEDKAELWESAEWQAALFTKLAEYATAFSADNDNLPLAERELVKQKAKRAQIELERMEDLMPGNLREDFYASDDYQDMELAKAVYDDIQASKAMLRDAQRQVRIHNLAQTAKVADDTRKAAQALLDSLKPKAAPKSKADPEKAVKAKAAKAKAKAEAKATKAKPEVKTEVAAAPAKPLSGIAGTQSAFALNTKGVRH